MPTQPFAVETLLSARLFLAPQVVGERLYFLSDLSGRISLYRMDRGGSVPEPLIPPHIALPLPDHIGGIPFYVFPRLGKLVVMIDHDGDENYQPHWVPIEGGIPQPMFAQFAGQQLFLTHIDEPQHIVAFGLDPRRSPVYESFLVNLETMETTHLGSSHYGNGFADATRDYAKVVLGDQYSFGDTVFYLWDRERGERVPLYGTPIEARTDDEVSELTGFGACYFADDERGLLLTTALFDDQYGLAFLPLDDPKAIAPVEVVGTVHEGVGEMVGLEPLTGDRFVLQYNIDGCSFAYEGRFDATARRFAVEHVICGTGQTANGVLEALRYDKASDCFALSFSTATSPSQLLTVEGAARRVVQHTRERILGIPETVLSAGEEASYTSHDGLRISARLYLPDPDLGFDGPRPVIFYIHGGPQSQERPDFTWFSMALIQFFTLNGFAVWVPNARGSSGYGIRYMKRVDRDWGGQDRLDHVEAFRQLGDDPRLDMGRVGVMGRSYGGYMTLTLAGRHPELWRAACDMFGPYNLFTFMDRLPETWKTYFYQALGHPERDHDFLVERSPSSYLSNLACPLFVIQGQNDPRVVEPESRSVVETLRAEGKDVEYLVFADEGHDVLKFANKVRCYNAIVDFFRQHLVTSDE